MRGKQEMYNMLFLVIVNGVILKVYSCGWLLNILFKSSPSKPTIRLAQTILKRKFPSVNKPLRI